MKYLGILLLLVAANFIFSWFNVLPLHWIQPWLIAVLFIYFIDDEPWIYYGFAFLAGLLVDAFSASFGLHALSYILVLLLINNLQLYVFTSQNTGTIIVLTMIGILAYWLFIWLLNFIFPWSNYIFYWQDWVQILKYYLVDVLAVVVLYILYFNFKLKHHER